MRKTLVSLSLLLAVLAVMAFASVPATHVVATGSVTISAPDSVAALATVATPVVLGGHKCQHTAVSGSGSSWKSEGWLGATRCCKHTGTTKKAVQDAVTCCINTCA